MCDGYVFGFFLIKKLGFHYSTLVMCYTFQAMDQMLIKMGQFLIQEIQNFETKVRAYGAGACRTERDIYTERYLLNYIFSFN